MSPIPIEDYFHLSYKEGIVPKHLIRKAFTVGERSFFIKKGGIFDQQWMCGGYRTALLNNGLLIFIGDAVNVDSSHIKNILKDYPDYLYVGEGIYHGV